MSDGIDLLDLSAVKRDLDALTRGARGAGGEGDAAALLQQTRLLLLRLQDAPGAEIEDDDRTLTMSWQAVRVRLATGEVTTITCWDENPSSGTTFAGIWQNGTLDSLFLQSGDRDWASRATPEGESRISSDGTAEGPADRRPFADLERRARDEMARWKSAHPVTRWICPNCAWQSDSGDAVCEVCGSARPTAAGAKDTRPTVLRQHPEPDSAPMGHQLSLPSGMDEILSRLLPLVAQVTEEARAADGATYEVVLRRVAPENRQAILEAVRDARQATGRSPAEAERLVAGAPSVICHGLPLPNARVVAERLELLGATVEIRKDRA